MRDWLDLVRRRDTCSQLMTITDKAYETGLRRLEKELGGASGAVMRAEHICLVTIRGGKADQPPEQG